METILAWDSTSTEEKCPRAISIPTEAKISRLAKPLAKRALKTLFNLASFCQNHNCRLY